MGEVVGEIGGRYGLRGGCRIGQRWRRRSTCIVWLDFAMVQEQGSGMVPSTLGQFLLRELFQFARICERQSVHYDSSIRHWADVEPVLKRGTSLSFVFQKFSRW